MEKEDEKLFHREEGKIYFSKATERKIFFVMTLIMLALGIFVKMGPW